MADGRAARASAVFRQLGRSDADLRRQHGPARENGCRQAGQHVHAQPQGCSYRRTRSRIEAGPYRKKCAGLNARQSPCNQSPCWHVMPEGWTLRARVRPKKTARRIMTMTFRLLLTAVVLATTPPVWAAQASDGY